MNIFHCPYASSYTLWERIIGRAFSSAPLNWQERIFGLPTYCTTQIYLQIAIVIGIVALIIFLIWYFKFHRRRFYPTK